MERSEKAPRVPRMERSEKRAPQHQLDRSSFDASTEGTQFFVNTFVATVNLTNVVDRRFAFSAEGSDKESHAGTDVRGFESGTNEFAFACDDNAMATRESTKNMRPSNIFSKKMTFPSHWVATVMAILMRSVG